MRAREMVKRREAQAANQAQNVEDWIAEELARNDMIIVNRLGKEFKAAPVEAGASLKKDRKPKR